MAKRRATDTERTVDPGTREVVVVGWVVVELGTTRVGTVGGLVGGGALVVVLVCVVVFEVVRVVDGVVTGDEPK